MLYNIHSWYDITLAGGEKIVTFGTFRFLTFSMFTIFTVKSSFYDVQILSGDDGIRSIALFEC